MARYHADTFRTLDLLFVKPGLATLTMTGQPSCPDMQLPPWRSSSWVGQWQRRANALKIILIHVKPLFQAIPSATSYPCYLRFCHIHLTADHSPRDAFQVSMLRCQATVWHVTEWPGLKPVSLALLLFRMVILCL